MWCFILMYSYMTLIPSVPMLHAGFLHIYWSNMLSTEDSFNGICLDFISCTKNNVVLHFDVFIHEFDTISTYATCGLLKKHYNAIY